MNQDGQPQWSDLLTFDAFRCRTLALGLLRVAPTAPPNRPIAICRNANPIRIRLKIDISGKKLNDADYRIEKMRYGMSGNDNNQTPPHYNDKIILTDITEGAYDHVVNGSRALNWVVEIMGNPYFPLELFQRVVTVSEETVEVVTALPKFDIAPSTN